MEWVKGWTSNSCSIATCSRCKIRQLINLLWQIQDAKVVCDDRPQNEVQGVHLISDKVWTTSLRVQLPTKFGVNHNGSRVPTGWNQGVTGYMVYISTYIVKKYVHISHISQHVWMHISSCRCRYNWKKWCVDTQIPMCVCTHPIKYNQTTSSRCNIKPRASASP